MGRRVGREKALQALFGIEVGNSDKVIILNEILSSEKLNDSLKQFTRDLVNGVLQNLETIDGYIKKYSQDWEIERIGKVELCALRIAIYEMLYMDEIPPIVSIDEALELIKYFSGDDSVKFVNGILDRVYKEIYKESRS